MHAISSYRITDPQTNTQTQTQTHAAKGPITIHCAAKLSAQCKYRSFIITAMRSLVTSRSGGGSRPLSDGQAPERRCR